MPPAPLRHTRRHRTATRAVPRPQHAPPTPLGATTGLPKHRCSGSSRERTTLACGPLPAPMPDSCHLTPSKPAGGSLLPAPRPLQRGAQQRHHRWLLHSQWTVHFTALQSILDNRGDPGVPGLMQRRGRRRRPSNNANAACCTQGGQVEGAVEERCVVPRTLQQHLFR